jgi:hypothetical protein
MVEFYWTVSRMNVLQINVIRQPMDRTTIIPASVDCGRPQLAAEFFNLSA